MQRILLLLFPLLFLSCDQLQQIGESAMSAPTKAEINAALKQALEIGTKNAVMQTGVVNGFYNNAKIRIPFPPEADEVEDKIRDIGLDAQADKFIETLNRGAEEAASRATPIFIDAITKMTFQDVYDIWRGDDDAATEYLRRATQAELRREFRPVIQNALQKVDITKYWNPIITTYNRIPFVEQLNPDLDAYVLDRTLDGLFTVLAQEEEKIRENPSARVTDLLKKVFGYKGPVVES